jgi:hypothetical protein
MSENTTPDVGVSDDDLAALLSGHEQQAEAPEETPEDEAEREVEEPEEPESEEPKPRRVKVKVDGQEFEVTEDELVKGYQTEAHVTKKSQALAEERRAFVEEQNRIQQERAYYAQRLAQVEQQLQPPSIDWDKLRESDPIGYIDAVRQEQERQQKHAQVQQERLRVQQQMEHDEYQRQARTVNEGLEKLKTHIPDYADPDKRVKVQKEIRAFAQQVGFSDEELSSASDWRAVAVLHDAMRFRQIMEKAKTAKPVVVNSAKPTAASTPKPDVKAFQRLRQSGRVEDAAAVLKRFL